MPPYKRRSALAPPADPFRSTGARGAESQHSWFEGPNATFWASDALHSWAERNS